MVEMWKKRFESERSLGVGVGGCGSMDGCGAGCVGAGVGGLVGVVVGGLGVGIVIWAMNQPS